MLTIYSVSWCPHCMKTVEFLIKNHINFKYLDIENQPDNIVNKVIEVNSGKDWVVPTIEYQNQWRPGKKFNENELCYDLTQMGIVFK